MTYTEAKNYLKGVSTLNTVRETAQTDEAGNHFPAAVTTNPDRGSAFPDATGNWHLHGPHRSDGSPGPEVLV